MKKIISSPFFQKTKTFFSLHERMGAAIIIFSVFFIFWVFSFFSTSSTETSYVLASVKKGGFTVSISGSGQVSSSNEIALKAKASGDVVYINASSGDKLQKGKLIAALDPTDAKKDVRDAEINLETAKLSLEELLKPASGLTLIQTENNLAKAKESKTSAEEDLIKSYEDGFTSISNAFLDLPSVMSGLQDTLYTSSSALGGSSQWNVDYYTNSISQYDSSADHYQDSLEIKHTAAKKEFEEVFDKYKLTSRSSSHAEIESLLSKTYEMTKDVSETIKNANNLIQFYKDALIEHNITPKSIADTHLSSLNSYTSKTNTILSNLLSTKNTIESAKSSIIDAKRSIQEKTASLEELKAGADNLEIRSAKISVIQKENALEDAKENLSNFYVYAPFDGTLASLDIKKADSVSSGVSIGTFISDQKIAEISLNEVDAAKVKVGNKVILTFDAFDGLSISGEVVEVDSVGSVSQGVVSYSVKINFDVQDSRIKSGMSATANIITDSRENILYIPNSSVKSNIDGSSYVEILNGSSVLKKQIEIGLANDDYTEILSGLSENEQIIEKTTTSSSSSSNSSSKSSSSSSSKSSSNNRSLFDMGGGPPR